jgi:hypothetical protein
VLCFYLQSFPLTVDEFSNEALLIISCWSLPPGVQGAVSFDARQAPCIDIPAGRCFTSRYPQMKCKNPMCVIHRSASTLHLAVSLPHPHLLNLTQQPCHPLAWRRCLC